ncbi:MULTISPECIES: hypothetical protein [Cupriavidus]|uniref:hypothetical protein n=1 Tax=Cupriavidus TaxID=106589 RepID=UPI00105775B7|nr:hypothetical protein [Cupriavidus alkaliphilus]
MAYKLYDYKNRQGVNEVKAWALSLQPAQRGKLNAKLDMLAAHGTDLLPQTLAGSDAPGIYKLKVKGSVQLRPHLCDGPLKVGAEFTLLVGAREVGGKLRPSDVAAQAVTRKDHILQEKEDKRCDHERVS